MVRALEEEEENYKSRLARFKKMHENGERKARSLIMEEDNGLLSSEDHDRMISRSHLSVPLHDHQPFNQPKIGSALNRTDNVISRLSNDGNERFAKLLLGEDMSGGGKGVSSALALSNAITNLAASAFAEQKKLEPMSAENKARWRKEIDWLLSVTDHIVELVPSKQKSKDGISMEIMVTRQRNDLLMNIPALRKLDAMLLVRAKLPLIFRFFSAFYGLVFIDTHLLCFGHEQDCLDNFKDQHEFYYASKDEDESQKETRKDDKWWIPTPKVPSNGLSEVTRKWLQHQKDSVNQVLKAAMAINAQVLSEMEIPENYIESLPKNGRERLGDSIYKSITDDYFDPDDLLSTVDLSSEHKILDLKNRIEASVVIWKRKMHAKDSKSSWGSAVKMEKRELFEDRAETILLILKHRFPGIPQSDLDISKIQYNRDVGQAILESYSRIIETLAFTVLSRIEDVMQADLIARNPSSAEQKRQPLKQRSPIAIAKEELEQSAPQTPTSMTLLDFMGWNLDNGETEAKKDMNDDFDAKPLSKPPNIITSNKKMSYIERLENLGSRSPRARH
ncbi:hypothetical protein BUALT_Bualt07G0144400 [Buddleja alternifolia]|uniref:PRONE domain-containing protein n=1 Tax=Buddleja alternifolia TaxID=168488 RepID=A0AAV6XLN1_9LAMI|nr:hypothetical protein BUALT_Bualt07G0144400 [Buddleja alternifolia]